MKKTASILLLAYYLLSVFGVSITDHYCCGKVSSVEIAYAFSKNSQSPNDMGGNCCRNVTQTLKIDTPQQIVSSVFTIHVPVFQAALSFLSFIQIDNGRGRIDEHNSLHTQPPPGYHTVSLFIRNESFLI